MGRDGIQKFLEESGIRPGGVYLLYSRPRVGKTALSLSIVVNSVHEGKRALIIYSRPRFPIERITRVLTVDELALITVCTPQSLEEQTNAISRIELLCGEKTFTIIVDEITDLYTMSLSAGGVSTTSVRKAAYEINKQLGFLSNFAKSHGALCLVTSEEREGGEIALPLQRILLYWSERAFRMSTDMQDKPLLQTVKPEDGPGFKCNIKEGLVIDIEPLALKDSD
jgi:RecA/RadA recombinase